jgi:hypothetical protein
LNEQALSAAKKLLTRPVAYHRVLAQIGGGATAGLMLSQAWYWTPRGEDGWFYKSMEEWEEETGLTRTEQETARRKLTEKGLLEEKRAGMPARLYFKVNVERILSLIAENPQTRLQETRKQEAAEPANMIAENPQSTNIRNTETTAETTPKLNSIASKEPTQPKKTKSGKVSTADPRSKHPAIQLVRSIIGHHPKIILYDKIILTLGAHPDGKMAVDCATECASRGWNVENLNTWLFDWYVNGIPERNGNGATKTQFTKPPVTRDFSKYPTRT